MRAGGVRPALALVVASLLPACLARFDGPTVPALLRRDEGRALPVVIEARLSAALPGGALTVSNETWASSDTAMGRLVQPSERALRRWLAWSRRQHPSIWLTLAAAIVSHHRHADSNRAKEARQEEIRRQVVFQQDFHIAIVTTAALPWMTGTAVNPLLRAAHLAKAGKRVTLMVPWLHPVEQAMVFPNQVRFATPTEQEAHIREWLQARAGLRGSFRLLFYPGRYDAERGSILPLGDITKYFEPHECDVAVLEEPEHLTWYHNGPNWRHRFKLVVGVVHTNYLFYAETWASGGKLLAATLQQINQWVCQAYCDKVIKLSDSLQPLPRAVVCNVHGVRSDFLDIGRRLHAMPLPRRHRKGAYFLGKVLWAKGHRLLIDYLKAQKAAGGELTHVDVFGSGEDLPEVRAEAEAEGLDIDFHGPTDHAGKELREYKVFVNPSQSEVLSTTTAEALAMGKFVVVQAHPSNDFFMSFANTLSYETPDEFLSQLEYALSHSPSPLTPDERRRLSWEGATERFLTAVTNSTLGDTLPSFGDHTARWVHQGIQKGGVIGDAVRAATGAGPVSRQAWIAQGRYKDAQVTELVEQSLLHNPPTDGGAADRPASEAKSEARGGAAGGR